jgi:nitrogen fixation protein NifU and related proteins
MSYSAEVLDHFRYPRHAGELAEANRVAEVSNPVCGDVIKLWLRTEQGLVAAASFKAAGCVPAIACGSWLAERVVGRSFDEIRSISPEDVEAGLGGLPPASRHAAQLAVDALAQVLKRPE